MPRKTVARIREAYPADAKKVAILATDGTLKTGIYKREIKQARQERDEARRCAEEMRDLYAAEIDESIQVFPWSWEAEK